MIDQEEFKLLKSELEAFDQEREGLIQQSRKLNNLAKKGMYNTHRDELKEANTIFKEADTIAQNLINSYEKNPKHKIGAVTAALQEWGECKAYYTYAQEQRLITRKELGLEAEDYLLSLADLAGELTRRSVLAKINKEEEQVKNIRAFVDELLGIFLGFNFRNGELRKKTDSIRWILQKIEELLTKS